MARPSLLQRRLAGRPEGRSGSDADRGTRDRPGQEQLRRGRAGRERTGGPATAHAPRRSRQAGGGAAGLRGGDGGLRWSAPPRPQVAGPRSRGPADVARVRAPLREGAEERRPGRRGDRRGGDPADDALRRAQERGPARPAEPAPRPRPIGGERTALINQLRAFLLERGIVVPQGRRKLELRLQELLAAEQPALSPRTRLLIE